MPRQEWLSGLTDATCALMLPADWIVKAQIELRLGLRKQAVESVGKAYEGTGDSLTFVSTYAALDERETAKWILEACLSKQRGRTDLIVEKALALGLTNSALVLQRKLRTFCNDSVSDWLWLFHLYRKIGLEWKGTRCAKAAIATCRLNPHPSNYRDMAILLGRLGRDNEAEIYFGHAGELCDSELDWLELAAGYIDLGWVERASNSVSKAMEHLSFSPSSIINALNSFKTWSDHSEYMPSSRKVYCLCLQLIVLRFGGLEGFLAALKKEGKAGFEEWHSARELFSDMKRLDMAGYALLQMLDLASGCETLEECRGTCVEMGWNAQAEGVLGRMRSLACMATDYVAVSEASLAAGLADDAWTFANIAESMSSREKGIPACKRLWFSLGSNSGVRRCTARMWRPNETHSSSELDPLCERLEELERLALGGQ